VAVRPKTIAAAIAASASGGGSLFRQSSEVPESTTCVEQLPNALWKGLIDHRLGIEKSTSLKRFCANKWIVDTGYVVTTDSRCIRHVIIV
jgi:hypothetical protein